MVKMMPNSNTRNIHRCFILAMLAMKNDDSTEMKITRVPIIKAAAHFFTNFM